MDGAHSGCRPGMYSKPCFGTRMWPTRRSLLVAGPANDYVTEREPVALWVTDAGTLWLLEDGTALSARHNRSVGILKILDGQGAAREVSYKPTVAINQKVMKNAQKLASYFPSLEAIMFHDGVGLNFPSPNSGIWVYWGG